jgi:hypothetical protein
MRISLTFNTDQAFSFLSDKEQLMLIKTKMNIAQLCAFCAQLCATGQPMPTKQIFEKLHSLTLLSPWR